METILNMKHTLISFFLLIISNSSFSQGNDTKKEWVSQYKESVVFGGFLEGLDNPKLSAMLLRDDKSFYNPFFKTLHRQAIKRGTDHLVDLINKSYFERKGRVAEPADGKQALLISLHFYTSKKLNEIAEQEYVKWMQLPNKKKLIDEVNKAY